DCRARDTDQDDQDDLASTEAGVTALAPGHHFDQADEAPANQQEGPVARHYVKDRRLGVHVVPEEQGADDQQEEWPRERSSSHMASPGPRPESERGGALDPNPPLAGSIVEGGSGVVVP